MAETRPWGITDFQEFFNREGAKKGNSKEFRAVVEALDNYGRLQGKAVSQESAMDLVEANDRLLKACEQYAKDRKGALSSKGEERLDAVTRLAEFQRGMNLDELRDLRVVRQHEGKTWNQVGPIPMAEITVDGKGEIVGANVSQRMKVEHDGKVGFFTAERVMMSPDKAFERMVAEEKDPVRKQILTDNGNLLKRVMRAQMDEKTPDQMTAEERKLSSTMISLGTDKDKKQWHANLKKVITEKIDDLDSEIQSGNLGFFERRKAMKERNALESLSRDEGLIQSCVNEYGRLSAERIGRSQVILQQDKERKLVSHNIATSRVAELLGIGHIAAHSKKMVVHQGDQVMTGCFMEFAEGKDILSSDYATQRAFEQVEFTPTPSMNRDMAAIEAFDFLCGQGDRHGGNMFYKLSEPDENGKRNITGIQGIDNDLAFGDKNNIKENNKIMFGWQNLDNMYFIDKDMAQKVRGLDRRKLEYALGDILSKEQIDAMEERVKAFQERLEKDMVEIEPDGWNLDKYNEADYGKDLETSGLDKAGKNYVRGLRDRDTWVKLAMSTLTMGAENGIHKHGQILGHMANAKKVFQKSEKAQDDLYSDMQSMFEASEQDAKEYEKAESIKAEQHKKAVGMKAEENAAKAERLKAKAEEIRARVEREKAGQAKSDSEKTNAAKTEQPKRERIGFSELEGRKTPRVPRKTGIAIGNHMERQTEKEKTAAAGMKR